MYFQRVESTLRDLSNNQPIPSSNVPTQKSGGFGNGLLNFGVALGGILLVTIITGIITYLYRKKLNCKQKVSSSGSKCSKESNDNDNISSIVDYYSNNYTAEKDDNNNDKNDASGSGITNDTTTKTNKSEYNLMNVIKNFGVKSSDKKNNRCTSVTIENKSKSDTIKNDKSKSKRSSSNEKIEYIVPQISSPISMPSASIYDIERASSLANSLSRSTAFQVQTPPTPPVPIRSSIIDKQPKDVERNSDSQQKFSSKLNSFYNLIPFVFMDSETETNTNAGPSVPPKSTSITTTSSAGVIPDWSKAPWNDDLTFHKNNNDNNDNNNNNNNNNNDNNNYDGYSLTSSRYSEDLIRFSNGSKHSTKSRINSLYLIDQQVSSLKPDSNTNDINDTNDNDNPELSKSKSLEYNRDDFIKELRINIEKDPEKYEFLKNPTENHHNWKRNGNFFEYRLQRSKTII